MRRPFSEIMANLEPPASIDNIIKVHAVLCMFGELTAVV
jgi:hypothetical protein